MAPQLSVNLTVNKPYCIIHLTVNNAFYSKFKCKIIHFTVHLASKRHG